MLFIQDGEKCESPGLADSLLSRYDVQLRGTGLGFISMSWTETLEYCIHYLTFAHAK